MPFYVGAYSAAEASAKWYCRFDNICIVNRCLYKGAPPSHAGELLFSIQCGLCSGDGLSENSPFKAESQLVADRLLNLLNLKAFIKSTDLQGNMLSVQLDTNPYGIDTVYILIQSEKNE